MILTAAVIYGTALALGITVLAFAWAATRRRP